MSVDIVVSHMEYRHEWSGASTILCHYGIGVDTRTVLALIDHVCPRLSGIIARLALELDGVV